MSNVDVLNGAVNAILPTWSALIFLDHPFLDALFSSDTQIAWKDATASDEHEFTVFYDAPGVNTAINTGDELIRGGRKTISKQGKFRGQRIMRTIDIPLLDIDKASTANNIAKIIDKYPSVDLAQFREQLTTQLAVGSGLNDLGGLPSFNGAVTFSPSGEVTEQGFLMAAAPASQNATTHTLARQGASGGLTGWANQYGHVSSAFNTEGLRVMRRVYQDAFRRSRATSLDGGGPNLGLADPASWRNYAEHLESAGQVILDPGKPKMGDVSPSDDSEGLPFRDCKIYSDEAIDLTSASFNATQQSGMINFINTRYFEGVVWRPGKFNGVDMSFGKPMSLRSTMNTGEALSVFHPVNIMRHPDRPVVRMEITMHWGLGCTALQCQGLVTGTAS